MHNSLVWYLTPCFTYGKYGTKSLNCALWSVRYFLYWLSYLSAILHVNYFMYFSIFAPPIFSPLLHSNFLFLFSLLIKHLISLLSRYTFVFLLSPFIVSIFCYTNFSCIFSPLSTLELYLLFLYFNSTFSINSSSLFWSILSLTLTFYFPSLSQPSNFCFSIPHSLLPSFSLLSLLF